MSDMIVASVLGSVSGLAGALVMPWVWRHRERARAAHYVAIRGVCVLDEYIDACAAVALDSGQENQDGTWEAQVDEPAAPSYPGDVDWRSIPRELAYELLSFPSAVRKAEAAIRGAWDFATPPDNAEFFEVRTVQYAHLGLRAYELAGRLRKIYRMAAPDYPDWDPIAALRRVKKEAQERSLARMDLLSFSPSPV